MGICTKSKCTLLICTLDIMIFKQKLYCYETEYCCGINHYNGYEKYIWTCEWLVSQDFEGHENVLGQKMV